MFAVDGGADGGGLVHGVAGGHLVGLGHELGEELVVDAALDKDPGAVRADLEK